QFSMLAGGSLFSARRQRVLDRGGERLIGMTGALFVAGAPAMGASQWQVSSESTTRLMVYFYRTRPDKRLGRTISNTEAWRQTALAMIRHPRYRTKPYYWAGFVVIGDAGN